MPLVDFHSRPQREVVPDPARLERAATLTNCRQDAPLPGGRALGGIGIQGHERRLVLLNCTSNVSDVPRPAGGTSRHLRTVE